MSDSSNRTSQRAKTGAGAGAAGAGGGTLLVLLSNSLPDDNAVKPWLMLAIPSLSVFFSGIWIWVNVKVANYLRDREVKSLLGAARVTLENALNNDQTTQAHRNKLRKQLEELELIAVGRHMERIQAISIVTEKDIAKTGK